MSATLENARRAIEEEERERQSLERQHARRLGAPSVWRATSRSSRRWRAASRFRLIDSMSRGFTASEGTRREH